jgi:hypothetical protein
MIMKKSKIIVDNDYVTLTILHTLVHQKTKNTKVKDEDGNIVVVPISYEVKGRTLYLSYTCRIDGISSISNHINDRNRIVTTKCIIFDRFSGRDYLVNNSIEEVKQAILFRNNKIGFK